MTSEEIKTIVAATVEELRRKGLLRSSTDLAYSEAAAALFTYYETGEHDRRVKAVLTKLSGDPYFKILPMFYGYRYTIESIAEAFDVEVSTVTRNKKRLCVAVHRLLDTET